MTNYRRYFVAGGSYFFTVNLAERSSALLTGNIHTLRAAWREVRRELPFKTEAIVVLPDHLQNRSASEISCYGERSISPWLPTRRRVMIVPSSVSRSTNESLYEWFPVI